MKKLVLIIICVFGVMTPVAYAEDARSTKTERNLIREGSSLFNDGNYHAALEKYEQALALNPASQYALYDKAATLIQLASDDNKGTENDPRVQAAEIFNSIAELKTNSMLAEYSSYNLGNMAFNDEKYDEAIANYKNTLRLNPENRKARQNLLLALKKKEEQEQNKDNQDKDNQDQQQDQQQQQQQQQQQEQQQDQQQQEQPRSQNAEQILQSVQNKENSTRRKAEKKPAQPGQPYTDKPW